LAEIVGIGTILKCVYWCCSLHNSN